MVGDPEQAFPVLVVASLWPAKPLDRYDCSLPKPRERHVRGTMGRTCVLHAYYTRTNRQIQ